MFKKIYLFPLLLLTSIVINAQYELGYIVNTAGENKIGYVLNEDWSYSPDNVSFKTKLDQPTETFDATTILEFGIGNDVKFIVKEVSIDISSNKLDKLSNTKKPVFEKKTVFLKKLVDGKLSLYNYNSADGNKFFVQKNDSLFEQLIYKKFFVSSTTIAENQFYKQQLTLLLKDCEAVTRKEIENLTYSTKPLGKLISKYNEFMTEASKNYFGVEKINPPNLTLNVLFGTQSTTASLGSSSPSRRNATYEDIITYFGGIEGELQFFNDKLGLFSGLVLRTRAEKSIDLATDFEPIPFQTVDFTYKTTGLTLGLRYYIPIVKNTRITLNAGITYEWVADFSIDFEFSDDIDDFQRDSSTTFYGIGVSYKRFLFESRINLNNGIFSENTPNAWVTDSSEYSFLLAYKIF